MQVCFVAEYFLPDLEQLTPLSCDYDLKILKPDELTDLYVTEWENALC